MPGRAALSASEAEAAYDRLINSLAAQDPSRAALIDRTAYRVLFRFFRSVYVSRGRQGDGVAGLAIRWLSGEHLDADEAGQLGLRPGPHPEEPVGLVDDQQVKQVLIALTQLAVSRRQGRQQLPCSARRSLGRASRRRAPTPNCGPRVARASSGGQAVKPSRTYPALRVVQ